jgi:hypothetical protein
MIGAHWEEGSKNIKSLPGPKRKKLDTHECMLSLLIG